MINEFEDPFAPLTDEMRTVLTTFHQLAVPHIVVGGFAVRVHGVLRAVGDLDLLVESTHDSLARLSSALLTIGVKEATDVAVLFQRSANAKWRWHDGRDDHHINLLTQVDGFRFLVAAQDSHISDIGGSPIAVLSKEKLIASKRTAAANPQRDEKALQDLEDLRMLLQQDEQERVPERRQ
jgi:hypothetical protein